MNNEWNLDIMYKGTDDPNYENDIARVRELGGKLKKMIRREDWDDDLRAEDIEEILLCMEEKTYLILRLFNYIGYRLAVNTESGELMAQSNRLQKLSAEFSADDVAATKMLAKATDIEKKAKKSEVIAKYKFFIHMAKEDEKYLLSDEEEAILAAMDMTGASAWSKLQSYLTSTVKIDYAGEQVTLPEIRNLAYSSEADIRKSAYDAEINGYEKVADSIAFALNNIKNQTWFITEKRGFKNPLEMTLHNNHMTRKTLDAMMKSIEEYLPVFRKYLKKKGELLGYNNGLPWFELFAPIGNSTKKYSIDEAKEYLVNCFGEFSPEMAALMKEAFENEWIDFYPRSGKEGGAFCGDVYGNDESRILTNYDGEFGAVDTLAHELGHAYHNRQLEGAGVLNLDYPMQLAETASTFNEVHLGHNAIEKASGEEKITLLEADIKENTQVIVDIYSRYLFETAVFDNCRDKFLMSEDLKQIMLDAQDKSYGDGLDPEYKHPYMWACKGHYYISGLSFYNFPYAFGSLFAHGLYALYLKEGKDFIPKYNAMLRSAGSATTEECGRMLGIDLESEDFWKASLQLIADNIDEFIAEADKLLK